MRSVALRPVLVAACFLSGVSLLLAQSSSDTPMRPVALHCANLFDAQQGKLIGPSTIVIEGKIIRSIEPGNGGPAGAVPVDLPGQTCLPGLIDAHVHLSSEFGPGSQLDRFRLNESDNVIRSTVFARRTLMAGFTTVRNLGDTNYETIALRDQINQGWIAGPRILSAGPGIGTTGGHADHTDGLRLDLQGDPGPREAIVNGPDDAWKAVRQHYKDGADLIKIMSSGGVLDLSSSVDNPQMTLEEIQTIVAAAHDYGFAVASHSHGAEAIRRSVLGGVDSIEHGTWMNEEDMKLMKEHGTWYVPTVYTATFVSEKAAIKGYYPPRVAEKAVMVGPQILKTVAEAYKHGVKLAYGTDEGVFPHGENWRDFSLLAQVGIPVSYALQMATVNAAQLLRREKEIGSITPGKFADVVAVPGNPLEDINVMSRASFVMKEGKIYKQDGKPIIE